MALHYIYSDAPGSTIDITDRCRTYIVEVEDRSEEGSVAVPADTPLLVDDPDGDIEFVGHRRIYIYEDLAPVGDQVIYNGFIVNERVIRGPYKTGRGRQWLLTLADPNVLINRRIMNGVDADRPAENDLERIQALLTMTELNTVDDDTYVNTAATTAAMDAAPYQGQNVRQYIDDCCQASGKNAFIYYNETLGEYGLWYDFANSSEYDSGCFLSNTLGDVDGTTTFYYSQERTYLNNDPSRVASGVWMEYDGPGSPLYDQNPTTIDTFAAIDWAAPSLNVKSLAKAEARMARYLSDAASEHQIIHTVMTAVPRASVNKVKKGQLVSFKASWMTGFEEYVVCRVMFRQVREITEDPTASFEIEMDLDPIPIECEVMALNIVTLDFDVPMGPTPSGFTSYLSSYGSSGDYVESDEYGLSRYVFQGIAFRPFPGGGMGPDPGGGGALYARQYPYADASMPTGFADGGGAINPKYQIFVVGPGVMTVWLSDMPGKTATGEVQLWRVAMPNPADPNDDIRTLVNSVPITTPSNTVVVPDDGYCLHYVLVTDTATLNESVGYGGRDWVAT